MKDFERTIYELINDYVDNEAMLTDEDIDAMRGLLNEVNKQEREIKKLKSIINKLFLGEIKLDMWAIMEEINNDTNI